MLQHVPESKDLSVHTDSESPHDPAQKLEQYSARQSPASTRQTLMHYYLGSGVRYFARLHGPNTMEETARALHMRCILVGVVIREGHALDAGLHLNFSFILKVGCRICAL